MVIGGGASTSGSACDELTLNPHPLQNQTPRGAATQIRLRTLRFGHRPKEICAVVNSDSTAQSAESGRPFQATRPGRKSTTRSGPHSALGYVVQLFADVRTQRVLPRRAFCGIQHVSRGYLYA